MHYMVFDTETVSLEKPFCYNVGYIIADSDNGEIVCKREYVIEQIWGNAELFTTAYYADKRQLYVGRMRARRVLLEKWGYVTQQIIRDIKAFEVQAAYAYNSPFDEKVFAFCCDWFKTINPFDLIPVFDIRGYVHQFIAFNADFQEWAENRKAFTEAGNFSTTAETIYRYISGQEEFDEEHTALADSKIENEILRYCIANGAEWGNEYKVYTSITREVDKELIIVQDGERNVYTYRKRTNRGNTIYLK